MLMFLDATETRLYDFLVDLDAKDCKWLQEFLMSSFVCGTRTNKS